MSNVNSDFKGWMIDVSREQPLYSSLRDKELEEDQLFELWQEGHTPMSALKEIAALITAA